MMKVQCLPCQGRIAELEAEVSKQEGEVARLTSRLNRGGAPISQTGAEILAEQTRRQVKLIVARYDSLLSRSLDALKAVEWKGWHPDQGKVCPWCKNIEGVEGHSPDCAIGNIITELEEIVGK